LSGDSTITTSDRLIAIDQIGAIAAGASSSESITIATDSIAAGSYFIGAIADPSNAIVETDETDNASQAIFLTVKSADTTSLTAEQQNAIIKLYLAYFNRAPESDGATFHFKAVEAEMAAGSSFEQALTNRADHFYEAAIIQSEFTGYSPDQPVDTFVELIYANVQVRPGVGGPGPDSDEIQYWVDKIVSGAVSRGELVLEFLDAIPILQALGTPEEQAIANQIDQVLQNRLTVAIEFAKPENSGGLTGAAAYDAGKAILAGVDGTQASVDAALAQLGSSAHTSSSLAELAFADHFGGLVTDAGAGDVATHQDDVYVDYGSMDVVGQAHHDHADDLLV
jgi:hypothetical protein